MRLPLGIYGAGRKDRVKKGYHTALKIVLAWGCFTTFVLVVFPEVLFKIFITETRCDSYGSGLPSDFGSIAPTFLCARKLQRRVPSRAWEKPCRRLLQESVFNALRIPMALALGAETVLGLNGIWWSISISSILKGIILPVWLGVIFYRWKRK